MKLEFVSLTLENFKTFPAGPQLLPLDLPGLTRIRGDNKLEPRLGQNDCGKSTLFDALSWCLFGRTITNLRNPDIKPWTSDGSPKVTVKLRTDGGKSHEICRTASPNRFLVDDKETDSAEDLLGFGFEVFRHTILLGQGQPLFLDLSPRDKMELFSSTLNLDRWEARSALAAETAGAHESELVMTTGAFNATQGTLEQLGQLIKQAKERSDEWEAERTARVANQKAEIETLRTKLSALEDQRAKADLAYDGAATELKALIEQETTGRKALLEQTSDYNKTALVLEDFKRRERGLARELEGLGSADRCPTCGQRIKGTTLEAHKAEIAREMDELAASVSKQTKICKKAFARREATEKELATIATQIREFRTKSEAARHEVEYLTPHLTELATQIRGLQLTQQERAKESNPHLEQLNTLRRKLRQIQVQIEELDKKIGILERRVARTRFWIKGFKEVRLYIVEEILAELELATNALLPESGLEGWAIRYAVERETKSGSMQRGLNVAVMSPRNQEPVRWEVWGGGVAQRLRLVSSLALSEVLLSHAGVQSSLEILDEPTRHLSTEGVSDLCEFLALRASQLNKSILFVDHKAIESASFSKVVTITKTKQGSFIGE